MPTFRLKADHPPVDVFRPAGHYESMPVKPGDTIEVPGYVLEHTPDSVVVGSNGDDARAWPLASWEFIDTAVPAPAPDAAKGV